MNLPGAAWRSSTRGPFADPARVDAQIAEEFAAHLELLERDLNSADKPPAHAAALAHARFGDAHRLARECRTIALKEHLMLKRLHLAVTITLAVLLAGTLLFGFAAAQRARREAMAAREMEMVARQTAEQSRAAEMQARDRAEAAEQLKDQRQKAAEPQASPSK